MTSYLPEGPHAGLSFRNGHFVKTSANYVGHLGENFSSGFLLVGHYPLSK